MNEWNCEKKNKMTRQVVVVIEGELQKQQQQQ